MHYSLTPPLFILVSLATATGIFLHDTRIDKAAVVSTLPLSVLSSDGSAKLAHVGASDLHTHVERGSMAQAVSIFHSSTPGIAPRVREDKKHLMQRYIGRGHHAFDNYNLPLV